MKIYIAGRYSRLEELAQEARKFQKAGFEITSRWLNNEEDGKTWTDVALMDLEDVDKADMVVSYTEGYGVPVSGGGRHVEFGYGLAKGKRMFIVGPMENIFHWHPEVTVFPRTDYLLRYLTGAKHA